MINYYCLLFLKNVGIQNLYIGKIIYIYIQYKSIFYLYNNTPKCKTLNLEFYFFKDCVFHKHQLHNLKCFS